MSYKGETYLIPGNAGGFTAEELSSEISPEMLVVAENINLNKNGKASRGGTSHVNSTAVSGTPKILGIFDFILKNGNRFLIFGGSDGNLYKDFTTTIKTGLGVGFFDFEVWNENLISVNRVAKPQSWDGVAVNSSDLANLPTDWTANVSYPGQIIKHGRGNSERMWALLVPEKPFDLYASDLNDGINDPDFSDANVKVFHIETGDGIGLTGGIEFGERLILFSKRRAYIFDDSDINPTNWGYQQAQWEGGAAHERLIVKTPNDVVSMMEDGTIYSITAVQSFGDYKAASLTREAFIDEYIKDNIDLTLINDFHAIYDPVLRAIKFFMIRKGSSRVDTALVYFIDRGPRNGWTIHNNLNFDSGYSSVSSALVTSVTGDFKIYTGGYSGFIWELETANKNDNNNGYFAGIKTPELFFGDPRTAKKTIRGFVSAREEGNYDLDVDIWVDSIKQAPTTIKPLGVGGVYGTGLYGTAVYGGEASTRLSFDLRYKVGESIQLQISNSNVNQPFFISRQMIDYKNLGRRPQ
jgi:hypothetical protein